MQKLASGWRQPSLLLSQVELMINSGKSGGGYLALVITN